MPLYSYHCDDCDHAFDEMARMSDYKEPQPCPECGVSAPRVMGDRFPGVVLAGDGWVSKNERIRGQMRAKNKRLAAKEREMKGDGVLPSLQPNVGGERTETWAEASRLAKSKGKDTSGYNTYAHKEKAGSA